MAFPSSILATMELCKRKCLYEDMPPMKPRIIDWRSNFEPC